MDENCDIVNYKFKTENDLGIYAIRIDQMHTGGVAFIATGLSDQDKLGEQFRGYLEEDELRRFINELSHAYRHLFIDMEKYPLDAPDGISEVDP